MSEVINPYLKKSDDNDLATDKVLNRYKNLPQRENKSSVLQKSEKRQLKNLIKSELDTNVGPFPMKAGDVLSKKHKSAVTYYESPQKKKDMLEWELDAMEQDTPGDGKAQGHIIYESQEIKEEDGFLKKKKISAREFEEEVLNRWKIQEYKKKKYLKKLKKQLE